jgi:hypothetical protein
MAWKLNSLWRSGLWGAFFSLAAITVSPLGEKIAVEFSKKHGWISGSVETLLDSAADQLRLLWHDPLFWTGSAFIIGLLAGSVIDRVLRKFDVTREPDQRRNLVNLGHQVAAAAVDMLPRDVEDDRLTHPVGISKVITLLHDLRRFQIPLPEGETNPRIGRSKASVVFSRSRAAPVGRGHRSCSRGPPFVWHVGNDMTCLSVPSHFPTSPEMEERED